MILFCRIFLVLDLNKDILGVIIKNDSKNFFVGVIKFWNLLLVVKIGILNVLVVK